MRHGFGVAACILIGLSGCANHVGEIDKSEGWAYREGSALELRVRVEPAAAAIGGVGEAERWRVGVWTGEGKFAAPPVYSQRSYVLEVRGDRVGGGGGGGGIGGVSRRTQVGGLDELAGLPAAEEEFEERRVSLRLRRDAGSLVLEGEKEGARAGGEAWFEKDPEFAVLVSALAGSAAGPDELAAMAFADVRREDVEALRASGRRLSPAEVIALRDGGMSGEYLRRLSETGREFTLEEAAELRRAGVDGEYVQSLAAAGMTPSAKELVRLKRNSVTSAFVEGLRGGEGSEGVGLPPPDEIIRFRNSGMSSRYAGELRRAGYDVSVDEALRLSRGSVSASYARGIKEAGYDVSVDELIRLRKSGVSVQYVQQLQEPGYERMSLERIMEAWKKGLSAEFVKDLRRRTS